MTTNSPEAIARKKQPTPQGTTMANQQSHERAFEATQLPEFSTPDSPPQLYRRTLAQTYAEILQSGGYLGC